jgi:hypothetical protein
VALTQIYPPNLLPEDLRMPVVELPERLNAASEFVDVHLGQGRGDKPAILCGDRVITYRQLHEASIDSEMP